MYRPRFRRWFLACACLAMCLVIGAPLLSRALNHAAPPAPAAHEGMAHEGHPGDAHSAHGHADRGTVDETPGPRAAPDPHADHEMGVECDYCLIAARLVGLIVAVLLLLMLWAAVLRPRMGFATTRLSRLAGTLGARGPPAVRFA